MEKVNRLSERIRIRFEQHKQGLADKQQQLDGRMKDLLDQRERLASVAKHKIETVNPEAEKRAWLQGYRHLTIASGTNRSKRVFLSY